MTVVFSTYQSINVVARAQYEAGIGSFDLIICDEAHRTTGARLVDDEDESPLRRAEVPFSNNSRGASPPLVENLALDRSWRAI
jgi:hypothetical protein